MKTMRMKQRAQLIFFAAALLVFWGAHSAHAARFSLAEELPRTEGGAVDLIIDTQGQSINTIDVTLAFKRDDLAITGVSDGNSIVSLWLERPVVFHEKGEIHFVGVIPGGYYGTEGRLLRIFFSSLRIGESAFTLANAAVLVNDGAGTPAVIASSSLRFVLRAPSAMTPIEQDTTPPESFIPHVAQDSAVFDGNYFLVFSTTDKGLGIDHYEILESPQSFFMKLFTPWRRGESPYLLRDQTLSSEISVGAFDAKGNRTLARIPAQSAPSRVGLFSQPFLVDVIVATLLLCSGVLLRHLVRKRRFFA